MASFEIREGQKDDRDSLTRVLWKAFDVARSYEEFCKEEWIDRWNDTKNGEYGFVAVEDGGVRANLAFRDHCENMIRGKPIRFGAVWAVATEPHYRRKGMVRELFRVSFPRMRELGIGLSILDPFDIPFYEQFGYALAERFVSHEFTHDIIRKTHRLDDIKAREVEDVAEWSKVAKVQNTLSRFGSRVFPPRHMLEYMIRQNHLYLFERGSEPVGVAKFAFDRDDKGFNLSVWLVTSFVSLDVFPSIVNLIANQASNVKKISWWCDEAYPVKHFIANHRELTTKAIGSMMMRVVDLEKYCLDTSIPENCTESVVIELKDDLCPWNNDTFELVPESGSLAAHRVKKTPEVRLTSLLLSRIISGLTPARMLLELGELDCPGDVAAKLECLFPADSFMSYWRF
ncbi:MAG: GNAT family N-acetyltransferase [Candidatus Thorarchaeota archaeon]|nr:GNAT family N-acetyltransferase [Candidatus Thorarchaeota archaeon]